MWVLSATWQVILSGIAILVINSSYDPDIQRIIAFLLLILTVITFNHTVSFSTLSGMILTVQKDVLEVKKEQGYVEPIELEQVGESLRAAKSQIDKLWISLVGALFMILITGWTILFA